MLYSSLIVAASAFTGFASAQNNATFQTPIPCCSVSPSAVNPPSLRSDWCAASINTCIDVCGGQQNIASNGNNCDDTTLQYTCKCTNGTDAASTLTSYEQSVPALMCQYWYGACINATNQVREAQIQCDNARKSQCGTRKTDSSSGSGSASSSAASSASAARTSSGPASATSSGAGAAQSSPGAASLVQYSMPVLAGGLLAVFGMAL